MNLCKMCDLNTAYPMGPYVVSETGEWSNGHYRAASDQLLVITASGPLRSREEDAVQGPVAPIDLTTKTLHAPTLNTLYILYT